MIRTSYRTLNSSILLRGKIQQRSIFEFVQNSIMDFQSFTDMEWWATILVSTIAVKTALFPLTRKQIIAGNQLQKCTIELNMLSKLLVQNMKSEKTFIDKWYALKSYKKGVSATLTLHDVSLFKIFAIPLVNASIFFTFVYSIRLMVMNDPIGAMTVGGMSWFPDITVIDRTYILPSAAIGATYYSLEISLRDKFEMYGLHVWFSRIQELLILSLPFVATLPAGVFCYWIPSSMFTAVQILMLRDPKFNKFLKMPMSMKDKLKNL